MLCRFEDRLAGQALELKQFSHRIAVTSASGLDAAFRDIACAQARGHWIALLLDYELGEWLEPSCAEGAALAPSPGASAAPRLTALVYQAAERVPVWPASAVAGMPAAGSALPLAATALLPRAQYLAHIDSLRASIARGELYQANYTFPIAIDSGLPPQALYRAIAPRHPSAHAAYVEDEGRTLLSFSPELFFARHGATLTVRPMKGTAPRFDDPGQDRQSGQQLLHSEKNRAENLMIVDLLRNDLGRVATPGSVKVEALFTLEQYPSVWTLTSTVTAQAPGVSLETLLRALFPCGSITGAPKIAAMRRLRALETARRGIYCGSIGWLAPNGDCSLNVAIRTITMHGGAQPARPRPGQSGQPGRQHGAAGPEAATAGTSLAGASGTVQASGTANSGFGDASAAPRFHGVFGVGGGIVHDSIPEQEWEECLWKARILGTPLMPGMNGATHDLAAGAVR